MLDAQCEQRTKLLRIRADALKRLLDGDLQLGYAVQSYLSGVYYRRYVDVRLAAADEAAGRSRGRRAQVREAAPRASEHLEADPRRALEAPQPAEPEGGPRDHVAGGITVDWRSRLLVRINEEWTWSGW
jgi:hypothetical protein